MMKTVRGYNYTVGANNNTTTLSVSDVDVPEISIQRTLTVNADSEAVLTLTSDIQPLNALDISYRVTNSVGEF